MSRKFFLFLALPLIVSLSFPAVVYSKPTTHLKTPSARDGGVHQELAWILGADVSPAQASQLAAGAKELVSTAFDENRAFVTVGASDKEIAKQVDAYARAYHARTGRRFSVAGTEVFTNFGNNVKEISGEIGKLARSWRERAGKGFGRDKRNEDGTPDYHEVNIKDALAERLARASSFIQETLASGEGTVYANTAKRLSEETRIVLVLDEEGIPTLLSNGVEGTPEHQALVSYAGRHRYAGWKGGDTTTPNRARSIYLSLVQVEELMKRADKETLGSLLYHHDRDLQNGKHEDPSPAAAERVNSVLQEIFTAYREKYLAKVEAEHKTKLQRVTTTVVSLDVATWLGGATRIPDEVVAFAENELKNEMAAGTITAFVVKARGKDLDIQANHQKGSESPIIQKILTDLMVRTLVQAVSPSSETREEVHQTARSYVSYRPAEMTYTERGAEPILIAKAIDAGPGFFNKALWNIFSHPDLQSTTTIDAFAAPGFRYVLSSVEDLKAGKKNPRTLVFTTPKDRDLLQSFASNPDAWVITEVYTTVDTLTGGKIPTDEPIATVSYQVVENAKGEKSLLNPNAIIRMQSGSPAVGEATNAIFRPQISIGGPNGEYNVAVFPVSDEEARTAAYQPGMARVAAYGYQSSEEKPGSPIFGRIPEDPVTNKQIVYDQVPRSSAARLVREKSALLAKLMNDHGEFDPYVVASVAEARAEKAKEANLSRFEKLPGLAKEDDVMAASRNPLEGHFTVSLIKIDTGGDIGHQGVPTEYRVVTEASLAAAREASKGQLFSDAHFGWAGDDNQINMVHRHGVDNDTIHSFDIQVFWRQVWAATAAGHKWYGRGQDLVGEAIKKGDVEIRAGLNDEFIEALGKQLAGEKSKYFAKVKAAYETWKQKTGGQEVGKPYSGNVQAMGPGLSELVVKAGQQVGKLAMDKTGPGAFNIPFWWAANQALERGVYDDLIFEIWDTEKHERIFVSLKEERPLARQLLGAVNRFNIKRIWTRKPGHKWVRSKPKESISDLPIASLSTERLSIISGGEYLGKDDPVALAHIEFMDIVFEFMRDHFYMNQGDERGSHYMMPLAEAHEDAVATLRSRAVQTAERYVITSDGKYAGREDVYKEPAYETARRRQVEYNELIWAVQGSEWPPVGVGPAQIEASYPAARLMEELEAEDSEYRIERTLTLAESHAASKWADLFPAIGRSVSPKVARMAADGGNKVILINAETFIEGPDGLLAIQKYFRDLGFETPEEALKSPVKIYINVPKDVKPSEGNEIVDRLLRTAKEKTDGAVTLTRDWFAGVVSGTSADDVQGKILNVEAGIDVVIGPTEWAHGLQRITGPTLVTVALDPSPDQEARSGAAAFLMAIEALANNKVIDEALAQKLSVQIDQGALSIIASPVSPKIETDLTAYREAMRKV